MSPRRTVGYVKLEWTCPNCSTRNPGPQKTCTNCGAAQPENVQFERSSEETLITDASAVRAAQAGADFVCPYCATRNSAEAKVCAHCGGDLVEARRRAAGVELQANASPQTLTCANCGTSNPVANISCSKCGAPLPRPTAPEAAAVVTGIPSAATGPAKKINWFLFAGIGAALLVCCIAVLFLFVFPSSSLQATVTDVHWQTSVPVQEQREVNHTNEEGSPPGDAYNVSCHTESHQVCDDKVVDQGNGYGQKVQDCRDISTDYCSYTEKEWQTIQTYTLDGHDFSPTYSQPNLASGQRLGDQSVDYTVYFNTKKGQETYSPHDLGEFQQYEIGSIWTSKLNALGGVLKVQK